MSAVEARTGRRCDVTGCADGVCVYVVDSDVWLCRQHGGPPTPVNCRYCGVQMVSLTDHRGNHRAACPRAES